MRIVFGKLGDRTIWVGGCEVGQVTRLNGDDALGRSEGLVLVTGADMDGEELMAGVVVHKLQNWKRAAKGDLNACDSIIHTSWIHGRPGEQYCAARNKVSLIEPQCLHFLPSCVLSVGLGVCGGGTWAGVSAPRSESSDLLSLIEEVDQNGRRKEEIAEMSQNQFVYGNAHLRGQLLSGLHSKTCSY